MTIRATLVLAASLLAWIPGAQAAVEPKAVIATYIDTAQAMFSDAHAGAQVLSKAVDKLLANPTPESLAAAREAWKSARVPYMQTEAFRFGNPRVDAWEGRVNAWPLDEGLIDYVDASIYGETSDENPLYRANVIGSKSIRIGNKQVDVRRITKKLLGTLVQAGGVEKNVATGWHAVEFLLWGQDLNGTGPGAGNRPATDYSLKSCSNGNCDRRRAYLKAVTGLLVDDLAEMVAAWGPKGAARADLLKLPAEAQLATILTGIGSLSYGELAGERMKLGLILHDPEEEQDCFSDNTHNAHYYDQVGMIAIYQGRYARPGSKVLEGVGMAAYAKEKAPEEAAAVEAAMTATLARLAAIKERADSGKEAYDQMIAEGNLEGNKLVQDGIDALIAQTRALEAMVGKLALTVNVEGAKSVDLDGPTSERSLVKP